MKSILKIPPKIWHQLVKKHITQEMLSLSATRPLSEIYNFLCSHGIDDAKCIFQFNGGKYEIKGRDNLQGRGDAC